MKILLFGVNGQLGWELSRSLQPLGDVITSCRSQCDFTRRDEVINLIEYVKPDVIVNAAAYTNVEGAEENPSLSKVINTDAPAIMAEMMKKRKGLIIYYSTDYVFDGAKKTPYKENDSPNPVNIYGMTKLGGEDVIRQSGCEHIIFRCGWIYSLRGHNFPLTIIKKAITDERIEVVNDCIGAPTSAEFIADVTSLVLLKKYKEKTKESIKCTYHLVASGSTSWYGYAEYLLNQIKEKKPSINICANEIIPIDLSLLSLKASRPINSKLDSSKIMIEYNLHIPSWKKQIDRFVAELNEIQFNSVIDK